jgi:hypothetical protein
VNTLPTIEHQREIIRDDDGAILQIYNHLIYRFHRPNFVARAYLDEPGRVAILTSGEVPDHIMSYLKDRFWQIDQIGGGGYVTLWTE